MKYRAHTLKASITTEITPLGWATLITRALPELLQHNSSFSAYRINKRTLWSESEIDIIKWYFNEIYDKEMPVQLLLNSTYQSKSYLGVSGFTFTQVKKQWSKNTCSVFNYFRQH